MTFLRALFPWGVHSHTRFKLGDQRFLVGEEGVRALEILRQVRFAPGRETSVCHLLPFRREIREIETLNTRAVLTYVVLHSQDEHLRRLAVWLRGRCGGYLGTKIIAQCARSSDDVLRKEAVRALRRLSGWTALRELLDLETNPRIRALASQKVTTSFDRRKSRFLANLTILESSPSPTGLAISDQVAFGKGRPPKQPWFIRQVLARIHAIVTGA